MPAAGSGTGSPTIVDAIVPLHRAGFADTLSLVAAIATLPGQVVVSAILAAPAWLALHRRGATATAAAWAAALALATAIEVVCKQALVRPPLERAGVQLAGFDSSWPSGHALRAALLAATLAAAWPRLRPLLAVWLAVAVALLEVSGAHVPSDLLGGLLLAVFLAAGARLAERSALLRGGRARRAGGRAAAGRRGP
jgi:membrane-associated phospholipid phosphatase